MPMNMTGNRLARMPSCSSSWLEKAVRTLILARIGAQAAVGLEQVVDAVDDVLAVRAGAQAQGQVVERAIQS